MFRLHRIAVIISLVLLISPYPLHAMIFVNRPDYSVPSNSVVTEESLVLSKSIDVQGTAADDLFLIINAAGWADRESGKVAMSGAFSNDVWAAGRIVTFSGQTWDHARLIGATSVSVRGIIRRNLFALGSIVYLGPDAHIDGSALLIGNTLALNGTIAGDVQAKGREITLSGTYGSNVFLVATGPLIVMPGTVIQGDLHYTASSELILDSKVKLSGKLIRDISLSPEKGFSWTALVVEIGFFCMALVTGLLLTTYFPGFTLNTIQHLEQARGKSFLVGLAALIIFPLAGIAIAATAIGLPLGLLILGLYLALLYLSKFTIALALGRMIFAQHSSTRTLLSTLMIGLVIVYISVNLPYPVGIIAWVGVAVMGLGAMVLTILDRRIPVFIAPEQKQGQESQSNKNT